IYSCARNTKLGLAACTFAGVALMEANNFENVAFRFDSINVFTRRRSGKPVLGEIFDIDILGPDNGSVALAAFDSDSFVFHTVKTKKYGRHPECGSREFGYEELAGATKFYTRGASRPSAFVAGVGGGLVRLGGKLPQMAGWTRLMMGVAGTIRARG